MVITDGMKPLEQRLREAQAIREELNGLISPIRDPPPNHHTASGIRARRNLPYLPGRRNGGENDGNVFQPVTSQNGQGWQTTRSTNPSNPLARSNVLFPPPPVAGRGSSRILQGGRTSQSARSQNRNVFQNSVSQIGQDSQENRPRIVSIPSNRMAALLPFPLSALGCGRDHASQGSTSVGQRASESGRNSTVDWVNSESLTAHSGRRQVSEDNEVRNHLHSQPNRSRSISVDSEGIIPSVPLLSSSEISPFRDPNISDYQYAPRTFQPSHLTLKQACSVMVTFDIDHHYELIKKTLCKFSVLIYGLEDCPRRDLRLAVFLFIEKYFCIQPVIELCVRHIPDKEDPNVVGVLFERSTARQTILNNLLVLENRNYRIAPNEDVSWIVRNYDYQA